MYEWIDGGSSYLISALIPVSSSVAYAWKIRVDGGAFSITVAMERLFGLMKWGVLSFSSWTKIVTRAVLESRDEAAKKNGKW